MLSRGFKSVPDLIRLMRAAQVPAELIVDSGFDQSPSFALGACTMRYLFSPKTELMRALEPYLGE